VEKLKGFYAKSNDAQGSSQTQQKLDSSTAKLAEYRTAEGELLELQHTLLRERASSKRAPAPQPSDVSPLDAPSPPPATAAVTTPAAETESTTITTAIASSFDASQPAPVPPSSVSSEVRALALYDFAAEEETALSFRQEDVLTVLSQDEGEWWYASLNGAEGYVPFNFLRIIEEQ
jgi:Variant SH3 domain